MSNNCNLDKAKKVKNDEFYTFYDDIEKELYNYDFDNKIIYCNCDNYLTSNFYKFFYDNYVYFGLKKLICTGYNANGKGYCAIYDGHYLYTCDLLSNGSFDSEECLRFLSLADVVVTNPPFSLFREYIRCLTTHHKDFLIVGTEGAAVYKELFPYIKRNKVGTGINLIKGFIDDNNELVRFGNICWWTTLNANCSKRHLDLTEKNTFVRYENYNAINVDSVKDIPSNYNEVMGVPVTFLKYNNIDNYDIIGITSSTRELASNYHINGTTTRGIVNGKKKFARLLIKKKVA